MTEQSEQHEEVREIRIGFTLIDIACAVTYIALAGAMAYLYGLTAGMLVLAAGLVTAYSAQGVVRRMVGHEAFRVLNKLAEETRTILSLAAKENKELREQLRDAQAK